LGIWGTGDWGLIEDGGLAIADLLRIEDLIDDLLMIEEWWRRLSVY
jgi:hypothetical protein